MSNDDEIGIVQKAILDEFRDCGIEFEQYPIAIPGFPGHALLSDEKINPPSAGSGPKMVKNLREIVGENLLVLSRPRYTHFLHFLPPSFPPCSWFWPKSGHLCSGHKDGFVVESLIESGPNGDVYRCKTRGRDYETISFLCKTTTESPKPRASQSRDGFLELSSLDAESLALMRVSSLSGDEHLKNSVPKLIFSFFVRYDHGKGERISRLIFIEEKQADGGFSAIPVVYYSKRHLEEMALLISMTGSMILQLWKKAGVLCFENGEKIPFLAKMTSVQFISFFLKKIMDASFSPFHLLTCGVCVCVCVLQMPFLNWEMCGIEDFLVSQDGQEIIGMISPKLAKASGIVDPVVFFFSSVFQMLSTTLQKSDILLVESNIQQSQNTPKELLDHVNRNYWDTKWFFSPLVHLWLFVCLFVYMYGHQVNGTSG